MDYNDNDDESIEERSFNLADDSDENFADGGDELDLGEISDLGEEEESLLDKEC